MSVLTWNVFGEFLSNDIFLEISFVDKSDFLKNQITLKARNVVVKVCA